MPENREEGPDPAQWRKEGAAGPATPAMEEQKAAPTRIPGLTEGRTVHYVLPDGSHRPAVVVKDWKQPNGCCNLQVLLDGTNDLAMSENCTREEAERGIAWRTSVLYNAQEGPGDAPPCPPNTWHWPEKA